jgi:subtilisin family serine protease
MMNRILTIAALAVLSAPVWAQQYREVSGVQEFSGEMIVRPVGYDDLAKRGITGQAARDVRARAIARIRPQLRRVIPGTDLHVVRIPSGGNENGYSQQLMATGDYRYAEPNYILYPTITTPNDPLFNSQWHHRVMGSTIGWNYGTGTSNVTVGICDTGIKKDHEDLQASILPGYNAVDELTEANGGNVDDVNGHGTHVAGCAAAIGNNNRGVSGVVWRAKILPVKVSNSPGGGAYGDDILGGAKWAAENGARVVSASYAGVQSQAVGDMGTYIRSIGGIFLYAAGNSPVNLDFWHPDTIVVSSSSTSDRASNWSAYGRGVHVLAPGENVLSTTNDGGYQGYFGTSMSTPVANGVCALIWSINPFLTNTQVRNILYSTSVKIPKADGSALDYSYGRVSVERAALEAFKSLAVEADFEPTAVRTLRGTFFSGDLSLVKTGNGGGYRVRSAAVQNRGHFAEVGVDFKPAVNRTRLLNLTVNTDVSSNVEGCTGMLYMWNYTTRTWDYSRATPVGGTKKRMRFSVNSGFDRYVAADGSVKAMVRIFSTDRRRGAAGVPFIGAVRFAGIETSSRR